MKISHFTMKFSPKVVFMKKQECEIILDKSKRETNIKGTKAFPVATYNDDLTIISVPYHWHEELELIVVIEGEMKLIVEMQEYTLQKGEGIFVNSGRLHSCECYNNTHCTIKSFVFHSKFIYGEHESVLYQAYFHSLLQETSQHTHILSKDLCKELIQAYEIFNSNDFGYEYTIREKLTHIILQVIKSVGNQPSTQDIKQLKALRRCKSMMSFIHDNFQKDITLIEIASSAKIKESEALRCFKMVLNTSPIKYLKKYRIEKAAILLKTTTMPIIDVGFECGFSEMSYFSKSFKELFGITPTEYRKV